MRDGVFVEFSNKCGFGNGFGFYSPVSEAPAPTAMIVQDEDREGRRRGRRRERERIAGRKEEGRERALRVRER